MWKVLMATLSLVSLSLCILIMFNPELSHFYLACIGREELFGWVILAQLLTLLQLNKNYVLFLVKPNCVWAFTTFCAQLFIILQPSMRRVFFYFFLTSMDRVGTCSAHYQAFFSVKSLPFSVTTWPISMQSPDQVALSSKVHSGTPSGKYQTPYQNPSSDLTTHQGSCKWDHLEHVHTRADLLLEDLQVQKDSGFGCWYVMRKCNCKCNSGMKENYPKPIKCETLY